MAKCHTFHLFSSNNFLVNVCLPFVVPVIAVWLLGWFLFNYYFLNEVKFFDELL